MSGIVDPHLWAEETFTSCELGDRRRNNRLIQVASHVASRPAASFPDQMDDWAELKAAYRLFDCEQVTLESIATPHWNQTRRSASGQTLVICDTTELDFGSMREGLGRTGNGFGCGFLLHNALMADFATQSVIGLAGQTCHYRPRKQRPKENSTKKLARSRESQVWGRVIDAVGPPPDGTQFIYVCDRGADNIEVFCHLVQQRSDWVIRATCRPRNVLTPEGESITLTKLLPRLTSLGTYELELRSRPDQEARTATLEVLSGKLLMPAPHHKSPWLKSLDPAPIAMNVVHVREVQPPSDAKPIEWILYTSLPATTYAQAWRVVEAYEARWLVEEYHKAIKSGCRVTARQLQTASRLEAMVGLMSVVAVKLLQLKTLSRQEPERLARTVVPPLWLKMLKATRRRLSRVHDLTVYEFYREVAKLGGFLGRKSDGEPGWITIWRGWEQLATLVRGATLANEIKCG